MFRRFPIVLTAAWLLCPSLSQADEAADTATARALGVEGFTLADSGRCAEAIEKLERAERLHHAPTTATRLAECEIELGKLVVGTERLQRVVRERLPANAHPAFGAAVTRAQSVLDKTLPRLATLRLSTSAPGANVAIAIDNEPEPVAILEADRRIDPGLHTIEVKADGYFPVTRTATLAEGETKSLHVDLKLDPNAQRGSTPPDGRRLAIASEPRPSGGSKVPAAIAFGLGAASLGVGIYAASITGDKASSLEAACGTNRVCPTDLSDDISDAKRWATISTASFIGAGVLVSTGVVLLLVASGRAPPSTKAATLRPTFSPTLGGVGGSF